MTGFTGVKEIAAYGFAWPAAAALVAGIVGAVVFIRRQRSLDEPLLDMKLFAERRFSAALGTLMIAILVGRPGYVAGAGLVAAAPPERSGSAAALSETGQEFGGALGLAVFGSIAAVIYRDVLVIPSGTPAAEAEAARDAVEETWEAEAVH